MYMNGRGPMMGGHRGPGMGPRPRTGYVPGMGFRPMRVHRRPMAGLFILPALVFGGPFVLTVLISVLSLAGAVIGGVFEGLGVMFESFGALAEGAGGLAIGIVIGLVAFNYFKKRKEAESTSTIDGENVESEIVEPIRYSRMGE